jgi:hypothetical protein
LGWWCVIAYQQGFAVLPGHGVVTQPPFGVQSLGDGLAKGFQQLAAVF